MKLTRFISALGLLAAPSCVEGVEPNERPWAQVPVSEGQTECPAERVPLDTCSWARYFDDIIVFQIDQKSTIDEPVYYRGDRVDSSQCTAVAPATILTGSTVPAARGTRPTTIQITGNTGAISDEELVEGTKFLAGVYVAGEETIVVSQPYIRVVDDVIVSAGDVSCFEGVEFIGRSVDETMKMVASCSSTGDLLTATVRDFYSGFPTCTAAVTVEPECTIDLDCASGASRCDAGRCTDR